MATAIEHPLLPLIGRRRHREAGGLVATLTACYAETFGKAEDNRLKRWQR